MDQHLSIWRDERLGHVKLVVGELGESQSEVDVVVLGRLYQSVPLGGVVDEGVLDVVFDV